MVKIIRSSTIPISLYILLRGQLKYLSQYYSIVGISSTGTELIEVKKREGIDVIGVNMERGISPIKDLFSLIKLYSVLKKEKPQIIHSITPKAGLLSMLAGKFAGVPIRMHTFTGLIFPTKTGLIQKILIYMDRLLCWAATDLYPEGNGVKLDLIKYKITNKKLKVLGNGNVNGIDLDYFHTNSINSSLKESLKDKLGILKDDHVFIFVGRIVKDKGINELLAAFNQLMLPNVKLLLVGEVDKLNHPISKDSLYILENNGNIISTGFQEDVRPFLSIANTFVFPSYREGFPNVVLQAGSMGLPSIVTNINGSNEIISDGINGTIISPKNVEELRLTMIKYALDQDFYNSLKENCRDRITARFEQKFVWMNLKEEYDLLLKQIK